jgi:hypothetical protein
MDDQENLESRDDGSSAGSSLLQQRNSSSSLHRHRQPSQKSPSGESLDDYHHWTNPFDENDESGDGGEDNESTTDDSSDVEDSTGASASASTRSKSAATTKETFELDDNDNDYKDETPLQIECHYESPTKDSTTTPFASGSVMTTTTTGGIDGDDGAEQQVKVPSSSNVSTTENATTIVSSTKERQENRETLVLEMESMSDKSPLSTEGASIVVATPKEGRDNRKTLVPELELMSNKSPFASNCKSKSSDDGCNLVDKDALITTFNRKEEKTSEEVSESSVSGTNTASKSKSAGGMPSTSSALSADRWWTRKNLLQWSTRKQQQVPVQPNTRWQKSIWEKIYEKVEPKKLAEIPRMLEKYKGRELDLVSKVIAKYRQKLLGNNN